MTSEATDPGVAERRLRPVAWANRVSRDRGLTAQTRTRAVDLADVMQRDGRLCRPRPWLAARLGTSESSVDRLFAALVQQGHLVRTRRGYEGSTPEYVATCPAECASEVTRSGPRERVTYRGALAPESASDLTHQEVPTARAQRAPSSEATPADGESVAATAMRAHSPAAAASTPENDLPLAPATRSPEGAQRPRTAGGGPGATPPATKLQRDDAVLHTLAPAVRDSFERRARVDLEHSGSPVTREALATATVALARAAR